MFKTVVLIFRATYPAVLLPNDREQSALIIRPNIDCSGSIMFKRKKKTPKLTFVLKKEKLSLIGF